MTTTSPQPTLSPRPGTAPIAAPTAVRPSFLLTDALASQVSSGIEWLPRTRADRRI